MPKSKINVTSNKLDQAPKTRAAGYEKNVLEPLQNEINKRMDMLFLNWAKFEVDWNKSIRDYLQKFLNDKGNEFIWNCILKTQPWDSFTFESKREKSNLLDDFQQPYDILHFSEILAILLVIIFIIFTEDLETDI